MKISCVLAFPRAKLANLSNLVPSQVRAAVVCIIDLYASGLLRIIGKLCAIKF